MRKRINFHIASDIKYNEKFLLYTSWRYVIWEDPHDDSTRVSGTTYAIGFYFFHVGVSIDDKT